MNEARLEDAGSGLAPVTEGWFVVNVRDAEWFSSQTRGAACWFANEYGESPIEFAQLGINVTVLEPGQSSVYHAEANQEAFLVLAGECRLLVEGEERLLRAWDFFHSPPWTEHAFVGAGDAPCVVLMVGAHVSPEVRYPVSDLAARYGASVEKETSDPEQVYATAETFPARAAVVLVTAALGLEPFAVAVRRHSRTLAQAIVCREPWHEGRSGASLNCPPLSRARTRGSLEHSGRRLRSSQPTPTLPPEMSRRGR